jgi:hypothetical protein
MTLSYFHCPETGWTTARRSWVWILAAAMLTAVMASKGMGSTVWYQLAVAGLAAICAFRAFNYRENVYAALCIVSGTMMTALPCFAHLSWVLVVMVACLARNIRAANFPEASGYDALALGIALMWCAGRADAFTSWITPFTAFMIPPALTVLLWRCGRFRAFAWLAVLPLAACFVAKDIVTASTPNTITIESYSIPNVAVFPHGKVAAHLVGGSLVPKGETSGDVGIVNMIFGPTPNKSLRPIYLVEHDIGPSEQHPVLENKSLHQQQPWEYNQLFGDEYVLAAIARDGYWASNLGGGLKPEGGVMLGSLCHKGGSTYEPIIVRTKGSTYIQDSDPFVDWLANGQRNVVWELTHGALDLRCLNFAAILLTALSVFAPALSRQGFAVLLLGVVTTQAIATYGAIPGDVLLIGRDGGPHELFRSGGVIRSLIESGRPVIESNRPSPIVVVARGRTYRLTGVEKLVILAPHSRALTTEGKVEVDDIPLGVVEDVIDARLLHYPGGDSKGVVQLRGVVFIATDAPAKLDWKKWFPRS